MGLLFWLLLSPLFTLPFCNWPSALEKVRCKEPILENTWEAADAVREKPDWTREKVPDGAAQLGMEVRDGGKDEDKCQLIHRYANRLRSRAGMCEVQTGGRSIVDRLLAGSRCGARESLLEFFLSHE